MNGSKERRSQGDGSRNLKVVCMILFALFTMGGMWVVDEDAVGADQVGLEGPLKRIWVEVAEEDMDEE